jgi:hypothetical protein
MPEFDALNERFCCETTNRQQKNLKNLKKKNRKKKNRLKAAITLQREVVRQRLTHHMKALYGRFSKLKTIWYYDQWFKSYSDSKF